VTTAQAIAAALAAIAPDGIGSAAVGVGDSSADLWPGEGLSVANAVPTRRAEFSAGRSAARLAMVRAGWRPSPLPAGHDRVPVWPAGLTGSIAHSSSIAISAVGRADAWAGIGIDLEPSGAVGDDLAPMLGTAEEIAATADPTWLFCAKEAVQKASWPRGQTLLEFGDVVLTRRQEGFAVRLMRDAGALPQGTVFRGHWTSAGGHVLATVFWSGM